jgi:hypothetical protein
MMGLLIIGWISCGVAAWAVEMLKFGQGYERITGFDLWGLFLAVLFGPIFAVAWAVHVFSWRRWL